MAYAFDLGAKVLKSERPLWTVLALTVLGLGQMVCVSTTAEASATEPPGEPPPPPPPPPPEECPAGYEEAIGSRWESTTKGYSDDSCEIAQGDAYSRMLAALDADAEKCEENGGISVGKVIDPQVDCELDVDAPRWMYETPPLEGANGGGWKLAFGATRTGRVRCCQANVTHAKVEAPLCPEGKTSMAPTSQAFVVMYRKNCEDAEKDATDASWNSRSVRENECWSNPGCDSVVQTAKECFLVNGSYMAVAHYGFDCCCEETAPTTTTMPFETTTTYSYQSTTTLPPMTTTTSMMESTTTTLPSTTTSTMPYTTSTTLPPSTYTTMPYTTSTTLPPSTYTTMPYTTSTSGSSPST